MQRFKPLLDLNGSTVIENAIGSFRAAGVDRVTVVLGYRGEALRPLLDGLGVRCVWNADYDQGMYSSVACGVRSLEAGVEGCFVLPADIPLVRSHTVRLISREYKKSAAPVVYPVFRGQRGHPPLIDARLFPAISRGTGAGGLRPILAEHEGLARQVEVLDEGILVDLDTPADYPKAVAMHARRDIPTEAECEAILAARKVPEAIARHGQLVSRIARRIADRLNGAGLELDVALLGAAGLLHDLAKDPAKGVPDHARAGARALRRLGYPNVSRVVAAHTDIEFDGGRVDEAAIVYLADKLVQGDCLVSIDERFRGALERFGADPVVGQVVQGRLQNARAIAGAVERITGAKLQELVEGERARRAEQRSRRPAGCASMGGEVTCQGRDIFDEGCLCAVCGARASFPPIRPGFSLRETRCSACGAARRTRDLARCLATSFSRPTAASISELLDLLRPLRIFEAQSSGPLHGELASLPGYVCSEFIPEAAAPGTTSAGGVRCEDLQALSFSDFSLDLVITQDVIEHVADPWRAFSEVWRVLAPGGRHVFTVPVHEGHATTARAELCGEEVHHLLPPVHHGDPVRQGGSLVFTDFGDDLAHRLDAMGCPTRVAGHVPFYEPRDMPGIIEGDAYTLYQEARARGEKALFLRYNSTVFITERP
jgi:CTP:molybdopterin cytidylyltransferase MocA